jgi:predicted DNA-binding protein (UPF0251 family)
MRPPKPRTVGFQPENTRFRPERPSGFAVILGLDMLEALRLVDAEGLPQDEAARRMDVSTATLCRLVSEARRRVAVALTEGHAITIEGGNVVYRQDEGAGPSGRHGFGGPGGRGRRGAQGGRGRMQD